MDIESTSGLRVLAINIMGRFLLNRDNNIRYVALKTMQRMVTIDPAAVTRHRNTIMDCLRDPDISIRKKALELTYAIINSENVKALVKELINFLLSADPEFKEALVGKVCLAVENHSPSRKWHLDTVVKVLCLGGNVVSEDVVATTAHMISSSSELHEYAVHKLYGALSANLGQYSLSLLATWCIGEFGHLLPRGESGVTQDATLDVIEKVLSFAGTDHLKSYVLTALIKLTVRFPDSMSRIRNVITESSGAISIEI
jgi:AP-1 complex subunit gamma-1